MKYIINNLSFISDESAIELATRSIVRKTDLIFKLTKNDDTLVEVVCWYKVNKSSITITVMNYGEKS